MMKDKIISPKNKVFITWMIAFLLFTIIGAISWIIQLTKGLQVTNLGVTNMWGIYITFFMIFTGVAAGCLFFASVPYLFQLEEFKPYCRIATFVGAVSSIVSASLFIIVDIGSPQKTWHFISSGNITSPMFWDFLILASYMIISIVFTWKLVLVNEGKKEEKTIKPIAIVSFIAGIMVIATSFVFSFQIARPMWHTPAQPISFMISAFVAALAILIILAFVLNKVGYIQMPISLLEKMGKLTAALLCVSLIIIIVEMLTGLYPSGGEEATLWLLKGEGAISFWLEIVALVAAMIFFLKATSPKGNNLLAGAIFSFIAITLLKTNFLQAELLHPLLQLPGVSMPGDTGGFYIPSFIEAGVTLGIISLSALVLSIGLKKLNLGKTQSMNIG